MWTMALLGLTLCHVDDDRIVSQNECHGTAIRFVGTPKEAGRLAERDKKLVMILHVSGHFEDPGFTWNNAEALRVKALGDKQLGEMISNKFVASFQKVGTFKIVGEQKQGGNVAVYFCAADGRVLHAIAGPVDAKQFRTEVDWLMRTLEDVAAESKGDADKFRAKLRKAHADQNGKVHKLLANRGMVKIEQVYREVFEDILGERVSTAPVQVVSPFPNRGTR